MLKKEKMLDVGITNASEKEILEYIFMSLAKKDEPFYIVTPNPEILVAAQKNEGFRNILNQARISLPDGAGVIWAGQLLGRPFTERIPGTDLLQSICKESVRKAVTVGFLGGRDGVAEKAAECLMKKYPGLRVGFIGEQWDKNAEVENSKAKNIIPKSGFSNLDSLDILFVAYGFPKQETWMAKHCGEIDVRVMMGVGGAFDYISGNVPRAPRLVRRLGFEWLYRLIRQPWRLKRQLALGTFLMLVGKEKFAGRRSA